MKKGTFRIHCHLVGRHLKWTENDSFYGMLYLQQFIRIYNHEYTLHPLNGLIFSSYKNCSSQKIKDDDESID